MQPCLKLELENQAGNITTLNISLLDCGTLPRSESNDDDEIIANTCHQLQDIIALYQTNAITKLSRHLPAQS